MLGLTIIIISIVSVSGSCLAPLGMENGDIKDDKIKVSSSFEPSSVGSERGRLNAEHGGGAWCPKSFISQESREYLEIDLGEEHTVTGVITQGRFANGLGLEFAEYYTLEHWRPGMEGYTEYTGDNGERILSGNKDTFTESRVLLEPSILATRVRIVPYSKHMRTVCMRIELLGCDSPSPPSNPLPLENTDRTRILGILFGGLLTLSILLLGIILVLLKRRGLKRYPSLSSVSISSSILEKHHVDEPEPEPVYQEPGVYTSPTLLSDYSAPLSLIYSTPLSIYQVYQSPSSLNHSFTDISYLDESSVDSSLSSGGTPRLPPIPNFDETLLFLPPVYVNQSQLKY